MEKGKAEGVINLLWQQQPSHILELLIKDISI